VENRRLEDLVPYFLSAEEGRYKSTQLKGDEETMAKKLVIPWELKADFRLRGWTGILKGFLYAIREEYGADATLKLYEKVSKMGDRYKNLTNTIKTIFKIEGNDAKTIGEWFDIWLELIGSEYTVLERTKTIDRKKITKCWFKTGYEDICDWDFKYFVNPIVKTLNPKATAEHIKNMCAGDSYCEFVTRIDE
jgi:hypothetical protein